MKVKNLNYSFFEKALIFLIFFILPFQTSKFFFLPQSYILGIRKDLLAPVVYFKYLIFLIFLAVNFQILKKLILKKGFILIWLFFILNFVLSTNKPITLYKIFQLNLLFGLSFVLYQLRKKGKISAESVASALLFSSLIEFFLSFYQFMSGKSFQGIFYFLGERRLDLFSPSVAKTQFLEKFVLRAYGTFSHPNSLAGFYLIIYFSTFKSFFKNVKFFKIILLRALSAFLIFLSFSKVAISLFLFLNFVFLLKEKICFVCKLSRFLAFLSVGGLFLTSYFRSSSLVERLQQISQAKQIFLSRPLFGVGLGAYLTALSQKFPSLSYFDLQPVHNLLLLLLSEGGIVFYVAVLFLLWKEKELRRVILENKILIFVFLFTSFFDHYWWSLSQNLFSLIFIFL